MTTSPLKEIKNLIIEDARVYADRGNIQMAIRLWRYSLKLDKIITMIEPQYVLNLKKKIKRDLLKELKTKAAKRNSK